MNVRPTSVLIAAALALALAPAARCGQQPDAAREGKALFFAISRHPEGLDPCRTADGLAAGIAAQIYEPLYEYHPLKSPVELRPCLADGMPEPSDDGLTWTIRMKKGVMFQDDPCFPGGKGREVTAGDVVYSIKRMADAANASESWWLLEGRIEGLDAFHEESIQQAEARRRMDYARPVAGLGAPDDHTLRVRLTQSWPQFVHMLAMTCTAAVPHEAVEHHGISFRRRPVGTGPFRLKSWRRDGILLTRNPNYRREPPVAGAAGPEDAAPALPLVDGVSYRLVTDAMAWALFTTGMIDELPMSRALAERLVGPDGRIEADLQKKGVRIVRRVEPAVYFIGFGMKDPVVGGDNKALRQAMSLGFDAARHVKGLRGQGVVVAQAVIPPGIFGYSAEYEHPYGRLDLEAAARKLAEAGYPGGVSADGRQLEVNYDTTAESGKAPLARAFAADMAKLGIKVHVVANRWPAYVRKLNDGHVQVFDIGWVFDYPDPENVLQVFYGPGGGSEPRTMHYRNAEFDELYRKMRVMPDGPERLAVIRRMVDAMDEDAVWIPLTHPVAYILRHKWVRNTGQRAMPAMPLKYVDIDDKERRRMRFLWRPGDGGTVTLAM